MGTCLCWGLCEQVCRMNLEFVCWRQKGWVLFHWLWPPVGEGQSHRVMRFWHFCDEWASGGNGREAEQKAGCAQCSGAWLAAAETWNRLVVGESRRGMQGPMCQPQRSTGFSPDMPWFPHHSLSVSIFSKLGHVSSMQNEKSVILLTSISVKDLSMGLICCL